MRLCYHPGQNFGDALNPIVFEQIVPPSLFREDRSVDLLGFGTILGFHDLSQAGRKIVFSSGCDPENPSTYGSLPVLDDSYEVVAVRGPLTAQALGLPPAAAVTDGAVLIREVDLPPATGGRPIFMPHVGSEDFYDWAEVCRKARLRFISPRGDPLQVAADLGAAPLVLTEAMHGAIVADALRTPWHAFSNYPTISGFKWRDWASSMELKVQFRRLPLLFDDRSFRSIVENKYPRTPPALVRAIVTAHRLLRSAFLEPIAVLLLRRSVNRPGQLSRQEVLEDRTNRLKALLAELVERERESSS